MASEASVSSRSVRARAFRPRCRAAVYYIVVLVGLAGAAPLLPGLGWAPAAAQVELTIDPAMVRGPADAPVTIVEFSDYQ